MPEDTGRRHSSKQFLIVKKDGDLHARLLSPREAARLMGAPDSYILPGTNNDGYKAMGDAVALPVASFIGKSFLTKLAEVIYDEQRTNRLKERNNEKNWVATISKKSHFQKRKNPTIACGVFPIDPMVGIKLTTCSLRVR